MDLVVDYRVSFGSSLIDCCCFSLWLFNFVGLIWWVFVLGIVLECGLGFGFGFDLF